MAKLKNPQSNEESIRQDYKDKHASGGALFAGRKYNRQIKNKDGKFIFNTDGSPRMWRPYIQLRKLIIDEDMLVQESHWYSEHCKNDCYCSINSFPPDCDSRVADNVVTLTGFYIDFDCKKIHDVGKKQQATPEMVEEAIGYADTIIRILMDYLPNDYGMPVISYTGGGYGFYFRLKPMEATEENKARYKEVHELLYQRFNVLFADIFDIFENDHAVIGDIARVIRITGTYNDKTGAFARYIARYGNAATNEVYEYNLDDIASLYHLDDIEVKPNAHLVSLAPLPIKREKKKEEEKKAIPKGAIKASSYTQQDNIIHPIKWYQGFVDSKQIGKYLELATTSLWYLDSQGTLQRNSALFLIACLETEIAYAQYGSRIFSWEKVAKKAQREIIDAMIEMNNSLSEPLEDSELIAILNHALTNNYHFRKLETIQKLLNLTDAEFDSLGWRDGQKRREQWQEHNNKLTELDKDVVKLYLSGLSDAKIGKELNIPKLQSIRIRKRLGVMDRSVKWEDVDFEGNKRHLLNKTHRVPDAAEKELLDIIKQLTDEMERIGDSQICDISPAKFKDFLENPKDFLEHLLGLVDLEQAKAIFWEKYAERMNNYMDMQKDLEWRLKKLEAMQKEAAEKQAEQAAKILHSDYTWFCHEPKFNRRNHANLVVEEIDKQNRAYYV